MKCQNVGDVVEDAQHIDKQNINLIIVSFHSFQLIEA